MYGSYLYISDVCFESGIDYAGNDLNSNINDVDYARGSGRRNSTLGCQQLCQKRDACKTFTYHLNDQDCYLKTSNSGRTTVSGVISGKKYCGKY